MMTLQQFALLINDFIERNFIPLLHKSEQKHTKALQYWKQVKRMIVKPENLDYWKLQNYISEIKMDQSEKKISCFTQQHQNFKKQPIVLKSVQNTPFSQYYLNDSHEQSSWKITNQSVQSTPCKYESPDIALRKKRQTSVYLQNLTNHNSNNNQQKEFGKLLESFRKLCYNFQTNHQKLTYDIKN